MVTTVCMGIECLKSELESNKKSVLSVRGTVAIIIIQNFPMNSLTSSQTGQ